ncbi:glycosyltransferase family 4 protein [Halorhabdus sp. CUG00001]|uniref:glycosyltransferase family 4 protein n=1 Tax=Halorhabdus sp. CUG00001 TaxID=2600297 RepID=UPI00131E578E|nr:glycosyltransferase family 4 protein [Halorhabdus sp. CUG00001]
MNTPDDIAVYGPLNREELGPSAVTRKLVRALDDIGCGVTLYTTGDDTHESVETVHVEGSVDSVPNFIRTKRRVARRVRANDHAIFHSIPGLIDGADIQTCLGFAGDIQMLLWAPQILNPREFFGANVYSVLKAIGYHRTDRIVAASPMVADQLRTYARCSADAVIPLGVSEADRTPPGSVSDPVRVLIPALIGPIKGQHRVLQHLDPNDDRYVVDIVGPVTDEAYAARLSEWDHRMHGYVHDIEEYYEAADIVLIPSEHDNHPTTAIETAGAGCHVIITDTCGFATLSEVQSCDGVDVVADGAEMASVFEATISDPERLQEKKRAAYELSGTMTWEQVARSHVEQYALL